MKRFFRAIIEGDVKKAREIYEEIEPDLERGYLRALGGFIAVLENGDARALLYLLTNDELKKKEVKDLYRRSKKMYSEEFRNNEERQYEETWMEFLKYYMNYRTPEGGLDRYMEDG